MSEAVCVLVIGGDAVVNAGIHAILADEPRISVVGEIADHVTAGHLRDLSRPDVLLANVDQSGWPIDNVQALREQYPGVSTVLLAPADCDARIGSLQASDLDGYLLRNEAPDSLAQALLRVASGGTWFSRAIMKNLILRDTIQPSGTSRAETRMLSGREQCLLGMLARGWNNTRIANELQLAEQTVRNGLSRLYSKLHVRSRSEAAVWARRRGLDRISPAQAEPIPIDVSRN